MGMSSYVVFLRSKNNKHYQKMLKIRHACNDADIDVPDEVEDYFGGDTDGYPLRVSAKDVVKKYSNSDECSDVLEIKVADIPEGVEVIQFINSY